MHEQNAENSRIILDLLESVSRDGDRSQRCRASEFGVAVGLVNSYLKFCVRKGYIKVKRIPAQRYIYFLTPRGFAEKSRLTLLQLSNSFAFFRQARADCSEALKEARARGWRRIVLAGATELAEISTLCALEAGIQVIAVVDASFADSRFIDLPVVASFDEAGPFDGTIVTDRFAPQECFDNAVRTLGGQRVLVPSLLGVLANPRAAA